MKVCLRYPDQSRHVVRLAATKRLDSLWSFLPDGVYMKFKGKRICNRRCLVKEMFQDGDIIDVVFKKTKKRILKQNIARSNHRCMITLDTEEERARMSCSHAIAPQALYEYCVREADSGRTCFVCPYIYNSKGDACQKEWPFDEVKRCACLSKEEETRLRIKLAVNKRKIRRRNSTKKSFPDDVTISMIHRSGKKEISRVSKCPARRACPECFCLIDHVGGCREMVCTYPSCRFKFCFICLKQYSKCKGDCTPAPLQFS